jgi:hypothetical protein
MRNYLALNFAQLAWSSIGASRWITGTSSSDMDGQVSWATNQAGLGPPDEVDNLGIWYFPLDKTNFSRIWNYCSLGFPLNGPIFQSDPPKYESKSFQPVQNTPRRGWTDTAGTPRAPTPSDKVSNPNLETTDFSGVPGLLDALAALPEFAAQLTRMGKLREAGIVMYAYSQVMKGVWTITEAFAYINANVIL